MRFASFVVQGAPRFGAVVSEGYVDLTGKLRREILTLKAAMAAGLLGEAAAYAAGRAPDFREAQVKLLPVIPDPAKILCVGVNYEAHRAETKRAEAKYPTIFTRFADTLIAHGEPIVRPRVSDKLDYEGELAIVIGKPGRSVAEAEAMAHVAGYAPFNDATVRDWQRHSHQFTPGKNFPNTGGFGPYLTSADEIGDYTRLTLTTRLNDAVMQQASLSDLIFSIPAVIAYCSSFTPLAPGDLIATGTPGGVGDRREPPLYMKPSDVCEVEISGVGRLVNPVVEER
jgi:2-keto-4-pentenoate hydratase/2-oxohepta-3-ene-1,7-dioic acid hydratase in catechol pathway